MAMICKGCQKDDELRLGYCFECAEAGEARAAKRTVLQHIGTMIRNLWRGSDDAKYDFKWAWERLTKTGDYAPGGYFERHDIRIK